MARKGGGARGRAGAPAPRSAPIHTAPKAGSHAWHEAKRQAFETQARGMRHSAAQRKASLHPSVHHGGFTCSHCGWGEWHLHRVAAKGGGHHPTLGFQGCAHCGTLHATTLQLHKTAAEQYDDRDLLLDVYKTMDTTETAVQRQDLVGHRTNCPRGGSAPCGAERDGVCSTCRAEVHDHAAVGKTIDSLVLQIRKTAGL